MSIAVLGRVTDFYPFSISLGVRINSAAVQADMLHQLWRRLLQWKQGYLHLVRLCGSNQFERLHALQLFVHYRPSCVKLTWLLDCLLVR